MSHYPLLSSLKGTADIQALTDDQKAALAEELRAYIIETISENGGHLAPNLGVIELTIALLATGRYPQDSIVFDVGHQCYAWKILTGRSDLFPSIRLKDGLSGFPKREESVYDSFNTGHSSTSISAALGLARAKRIRGNLSKTIALIGDGAIGGGMAFEALSDAGQSGENLLVILNDNHMSIDQAVGGLARHLESLRTSQRYIRLKTRWENRLDKIPLVGGPLIRVIARTKRRWRSWRRDSGVLFEQLGFRYYGPVDGHNIGEMERHLQALRLVRGPVLLHVVTVKGKGYSFAEDEPEIFHGTQPFDTHNGLASKGRDPVDTFSGVMGKTLVKLAREDETIVAITAAMAQGTGLIPFSREFPQRFFDVGIAEQHALTLAAGMAAGGLRPLVAIYSTFLQRAADQLLHDICLQNLSLVIAVDRAGLVGGDGETHQGIYDLSLALSMPNLTVMAPANASDLRVILRGAKDLQGPLLVRYPNDRASNEPVSRESSGETLTDLFKLRSLTEGSDLTVLALGPMVWEARKAVMNFVEKEEDRSVHLLSCVTAAPFDYESLWQSIQKSGRLLIIEDGIENSGFGAFIGAACACKMPGIMINYAGVSKPLAGQASRQELLDQEGLLAPELEESMRRILAESEERTAGLPGRQEG